jgi:hypothetical protein
MRLWTNPDAADRVAFRSGNWPLVPLPVVCVKFCKKGWP